MKPRLEKYQNHEVILFEDALPYLSVLCDKYDTVRHSLVNKMIIVGFASEYEKNEFLSDLDALRGQNK